MHKYPARVPHKRTKAPCAIFQKELTLWETAAIIGLRSSVEDARHSMFSALCTRYLSRGASNRSGHGGIGRRVRLRGVWATVRVQVPVTAPTHPKSPKTGAFRFSRQQTDGSLFLISVVRQQHHFPVLQTGILRSHSAIMALNRCFNRSNMASDIRFPLHDI